MDELIVKVQLRIFSGIPDPEWTLSSSAAAAVAARANQLTETTGQESPSSWRGLGYHGFRVFISKAGASTSMDVYGGIIDAQGPGSNRVDTNRSLESLLLDTAPSDVVDTELKEEAREDLAIPINRWLDPFRENRKLKPDCGSCKALSAPSYDPAAWDDPATRGLNNCYNYANDRLRCAFGVPGSGGGREYTCPSCDDIRSAAQSDGLQPVPDFGQPLNDGFYVALVVRPGREFHFYRQDNNGCWSHKRGNEKVRDSDQSGKRILDPQNCDLGRYYRFCTYMTTNHNVIIGS